MDMKLSKGGVKSFVALEFRALAILAVGIFGQLKASN